jgi:glucosamine-6-phosphate deaminase
MEKIFKGIKMNRGEEIRNLLKLKPDEVRANAGKKLVVCKDLDALHRRFARELADELKINNSKGIPTRLIVPVGPVGQYPYLIRLIESENISLASVWLFFMDEYSDSSGKAIAPSHPLSFRRIAFEKFLNSLKEKSDINLDQVYFPDETNIEQIPKIIEKIGGIDTVYGGIGIHGHLAFNEPEPGIKEKGCRKVVLNDFTITINAIRAECGGNIANFPREAFTLGLKEILAAKKIRLYCRNGTHYDWANTVLRIALFAEPGDDFPVTHIRDRDYVIITDEFTLARPKNLI